MDKRKPIKETFSLVGALNIARAHLYQIRIGVAPYIDYDVEIVDEAIRTYLEKVYSEHEDDSFEDLEKLAWESVLSDIDSKDLH